MSLYSSSDLLQRCKDAAQLPDDDEAMTAAAWYRLLTSAQGRWWPQIAAHVPLALYSAPFLLESTDAGLTYPFGVDEDERPITPFAVELYRSESHAYEPNARDFALTPGVDYYPEAGQVRFSLTGRRPSFDSGAPWARMVEPPGVIDATHQPVIYPLSARELLVLDAVEAWASQGNLRDPSVWVGRAAKHWSGDGALDVGLLGALKLQFPSAAQGRGRRAMVVPRGYPGMLR